MNINDRQFTQTVVQRLKDYEGDPEDAAKVKKLVAMWQERFPEAVSEQSSWLKPLMMVKRYEVSDHRVHPDEIWINDIYHVTVRVHDSDPVFGTNGPMVHLGINSHDGTARHDWRDFQAIKSSIVGNGVEAFELYPAESRVLDPSNYYSLWCFPALARIRVGVIERQVWDADVSLATQRAYPKTLPIVESCLRLFDYVQHPTTCGIRFGDKICDCGLDKILSDIKEQS